MTKQIDTLIEDIYKLFTEDHEPSEVLAEEFGKNVAQLALRRLKESRDREFTLRMSNLGKGARQLWYEKQGMIKENLPGHAYVKFMYGDLIEQLVLYLAKEAGHKVEQEQAEITVDGIVGHMDAIIDDVVVDVKSASKFAFKKFEDGTLADNDAFGYMEQLAGYSEGADKRDGAFVAVNKELGTLALLKVPRKELEAYAIPERIEYMKEAVASDEPPERCYTDVPNGESGNRALDINCSYCPFKFECWKDSNDGIGLRTFLYSKGPVHFTNVVREPKVLEITF